MNRISITIDCELSEELEAKLLLIKSIIFDLNGVKTVSYFNEEANNEIKSE